MFGVHLGFLSTPTTDLAPPFVQIIYVSLPPILCNSVQGKWAVKCWDNCSRYQQVWDGAFFWQDHIHRDVWGIIQFVLLLCFFYVHQGKWMFDMVSCLVMQHMKNYKSLLKKISKWMKEDSLLFVHHFCHKTFPYHFEVHLWSCIFFCHLVLASSETACLLHGSFCH